MKYIFKLILPVKWEFCTENVTNEEKYENRLFFSREILKCIDGGGCLQLFYFNKKMARMLVLI